MDFDPFPDIPRALLSSEHIKMYVRETAMIHPFRDNSDSLKAASYEARAGGQFIYWDEDGKKISQPIVKDGVFTLKPNSISYVQIEAEFRLPHYIAVRFNLRIQHVHRGILLGTGPLVDPGFHGTLLVPLHNLTSDEYTIRADEGLIWMEFTKTSHQARNSPVQGVPESNFEETEARKNFQPPEYYFDRASKNRPIRSSIPLVVADAKKIAQEAVDTAKRAERINRVFVGAGILTITGVLVGLFSLFNAVNANVIAAHSLISNVSDKATQASLDAKQVQDDVRSVKTQFDGASLQLTAELQQLRQQLQEAQSQIDALRIEVQRLSAPPTPNP